jgi:vesicle-fusing ATPase
MFFKTVEKCIYTKLALTENCDLRGKFLPTIIEVNVKKSKSAASFLCTGTVSYHNLHGEVLSVENGQLKWNKEHKNESEQTIPQPTQTPATSTSQPTQPIQPTPASQTTLRQTNEYTPIFKTDIDLQKLNIGGLDDQFVTMFRRAFSSRNIDPASAKRLGLKHVKGMLLYGPPGCGKTLIARKLCGCLNTIEPRIVNGPELLDSYVGNSEKNIRKLFEDAIDDETNLGDKSPLHVIIFDEFDSIAKARGGDQKHVYDNMVNQLLTMIDGVNALNNILIIGMTNRKDMIDPAILRPGRLEIHIEIGLPDERGRHQILEIHTATLRKNKNISSDVDLGEIVKLTKNYTGAEIEGMINNARTYALSRATGHKDMIINIDEVVVTHDDITCAIKETRAAFGSGTTEEIRKLIAPGVTIKDELTMALTSFLSQTSGTTKFRLLIQGDCGSGKTSQAILAALRFDIPCIKHIFPYKFLGNCTDIPLEIKKMVEEAIISPLSAVIVDDYDTLIGYNAVNKKFSNDIVQTIDALFKNIYLTNKIIFIVTCSKEKESGKPSAIEMMNTYRLFDKVIGL